MDPGEARRRQFHTEQVLAFFKSHPNAWIGATELEPIGGRQAWRTRVSEARQLLEVAGDGTIVNRQRRRRDTRNVFGYSVLSQYMYRPHKPLGPSAETERSGQLTLMNLHPQG